MFPIVQAEQWDTQWFQPSAIKELHSEEPKSVYNLINDTFFFPLHPPLKHPPLFEHMWSPSGQDSFALNLALWRERKCIWSNPQRDVLKWKRRRPNREVRKVFRDFCLSVQNRKSLPHNAMGRVFVLPANSGVSPASWLLLPPYAQGLSLHCWSYDWFFHCSHS